MVSSRRPQTWTRPTPYLLRSRTKNLQQDWDNVLCPICLEPPHEAVLLVCESHDKGCRPYMCGTGEKLSNCLEKFSAVGLVCPLCRGHVTECSNVAESDRGYLNAKTRACVCEECVFVGDHDALVGHVAEVHAEYVIPKPMPMKVPFERAFDAMVSMYEREWGVRVQLGRRTARAGRGQAVRGQGQVRLRQGDDGDRRGARVRSPACTVNTRRRTPRLR